MGSHHIQTDEGVIFNTPFARTNEYKNTNHSVGTIVLKRNGEDMFEVAGGNWKDYDINILNDPHRLDKTGSAMAAGKRHL